MRNDFGNRPYKPRFPYSSTEKKQGYNDRLDESLGERNGKKSQSFKDSLKVLKKQLAKERTLLFLQWINSATVF